MGLIVSEQTFFVCHLEGFNCEEAIDMRLWVDRTINDSPWLSQHGNRNERGRGIVQPEMFILP
jgi:hypothetical protein